MDNQVVVITGTSSGFGFLTALALAEKGYQVVGTVRNQESKERLLAEAVKRGCEHLVELHFLDVTYQDQVDVFAEQVKNRFGKVDVLINNAGFSTGGMTELVEMEAWQQQLDTNVVGAIRVTKAFLPMMREAKSGKIINLGSISGRFGFPGLAPYVTSKHALAGFSESLRLELLPFGIYVSLIEAGSFQTGIWEKGLSGIDVEKESDYRTYIMKLYENAKRTVEQAADPMDVVGLIERICERERPKFRYQVGKGVKVGVFLKAIVPWSIVERIVMKKMK